MLEFDEKVMVLIANLDDDTFMHSKRTSDLAFVLGQEMGLSAPELRCLRIGGLLHDVGKSGIPDPIISKDTPLTLEEWDLIKQHPVFGYELVKTVVSDTVKDIVLEHHRWVDGIGGYPEDSTLSQPCLLAQIVSVADVTDAMTHARPYRPAHNMPQCLHFLQSGVDSQFNGTVVNALLKYLRKGGACSAI